MCHHQAGFQAFVRSEHWFFPLSLACVTFLLPQQCNVVLTWRPVTYVEYSVRARFRAARPRAKTRVLCWFSILREAGPCGVKRRRRQANYPLLPKFTVLAANPAGAGRFGDVAPAKIQPAPDSWCRLGGHHIY